ncbi:hypothetical protein [Vibrio fluvialis]|uniref:hypothetical protein n=1 Tax=Vibrio fluvialis TaxID=676 RepID=UPI0015597113|nr:hypothetical protein [Vibrio fluvialis]ELL0570776.1 hypothetical protein [Vibrio fluvialis]
MTRNAKYEQRMKDKGFKKITLWIPIDRESDLKHAVSMMCENKSLTVGVLKDTVNGRMVSIRNK